MAVAAMEGVGRVGLLEAGASAVEMAAERAKGTKPVNKERFELAPGSYSE